MNLNYAVTLDEAAENPPLADSLRGEGCREARYASKSPNKILAAIWALCTLRKSANLCCAAEEVAQSRGRNTVPDSAVSGRGGKPTPLSGLGRGRSQIRQKNVDTLRTQ